MSPFYAIVHDVPASWEDYPPELVALGESAPPEGLLVHVAGPTDEGFRLIEIWQAQGDWERFRCSTLPGLLEGIDTTTRALSVTHLYLSDAATFDDAKERQ